MIQDVDGIVSEQATCEIIRSSQILWLPSVPSLTYRTRCPTPRKPNTAQPPLCLCSERFFSASHCCRLRWSRSCISIRCERARNLSGSGTTSQRRPTRHRRQTLPRWKKASRSTRSGVQYAICLTAAAKWAHRLLRPTGNTRNPTRTHSRQSPKVLIRRK